jgi:hypothetical protein
MVPSVVAYFGLDLDFQFCGRPEFIDISIADV